MKPLDLTKTLVATVVISAMACGCASGPPPAEAMQPNAIAAAQKRAASELACPSAAAEILSKETIQEPQGTGWYESPHRAEYSVAVAGCGKGTKYAVACDNRQQECVADTVKVSQAPRELADKLQPNAVQAAQQRGASELACSATTAKVMRQETIQEAQGTGWYESAHRAAYDIDVLGCGKHTVYLVACDSRENKCVASTFQKKTEGGPPQLADRLQPDAVKVAQQRGASELACPAATPEVLRQETLEEGQTTGWYEPPHRAVYNIGVSGCGKRTAYLVSCDARKKACVAGSAQTAGE